MEILALFHGPAVDHARAGDNCGSTFYKPSWDNLGPCGAGRPWLNCKSGELACLLNGVGRHTEEESREIKIGTVAVQDGNFDLCCFKGACHREGMPLEHW